MTVALNLQGPNNVKKVVADIRRQLTGIKADVDLNIKADSAKNIAGINKQISSLSSAAKTASANVTTLNNAIKTLGASFQQTNSLANNFNKAAKQTSGNLKKSAKDVKVAATAVEEFGKQSALAVKRFAAFSIVTSIINRFSSAVSDGFKAFVDFDRQLVRISQVTKGSASDIRNLSKEIGSLAQTFGVASEDLAEVSLTLAQAGLSANQARAALEALAKTSLAATFDNINNTTEGSIALMRQFKISVNDLESALGSINAVAGSFAVEASDIITAISRAGGVFAAASRGVSEGKDALNEFIAVFTSVRATTRESAETIATGLRTVFTRIQRGSTIKFLREFGVELQDAEGKFVGAYEATRRLSEGLASLDPRDVRFTRIVEELGGFRQIGKVIPLIQQFATAQEALGVAQRGAGSLSSDAAKAQAALAVQFQKTREEFSALIREIGQSATFQTITKIVLGLASAFIKVAGALKPILPLLTALTAVKGFKFITEFVSGFKGGLGGAGAGGIGATIGGALGGGGDSDKGGKKQATENNTAALTANTTALTTVTSAVQQLTTAINALTNKSGGEYPSGLTFASGGSVPGTGNRDTVPAMLTPGEFVIRKKAVEAIGADNLSRMNKYATGGVVDLPSSRPYVKDLPSTYDKPRNQSIADAVLADKPLVLNKKDTISAKINRVGIDTKALLPQAPQDIAAEYEKLINKSSLSRKESQDRGLLFEQILEQTKGVELANDKSSRIDGKVGDRLVEIKSTAEQVKTTDLLDKVAGAILKPRSNIDEMASAIASKKAMSKKPDNLSIGRLDIYEDLARLEQTGSEFQTQRQIENLEKNRIQRRAKGGSVQDTVPALLTPGEFVLNKKAAQKLGSVTLNKLNNADKIQGFNKGGVVQRFVGGGGVQPPIGGGVVDPSLKSAIDKIDANLRGLGALLEDIFVTAGATAEEQKNAVEATEYLINEVNKARASGDKDKIAEAEKALRDELKDTKEAFEAFKKAEGLDKPDKPRASKAAAPGGLGYPGSMVTQPGGFNATVLPEAAKTKSAFQKLTAAIEKLNDKTGSAVGTLGAGIAAALPTIDSLVEKFDRLNNSAVAASEEFQTFRGALQQGASLGASASFAAKEAGFGRSASAAIGGLGFLGGAISGGIAGGAEARAAQFQQEAAAANVSRERAQEDYSTAETQQQRRAALKELTLANAQAADATAKANAEFNSELAQAGRSAGIFSNALIQGISALALLRQFRGGGRRRGFSKGGVVYANNGMLVDYQPKGTDTIPAMLSKGEYVVNADATARNLGVLEAINKSKGGYIGGGVQYLQGGGLAGATGGNLVRAADRVADSLNKTSDSLDKTGKDVEKSGERWGGAIGDALTMTSDSTAVNVASFAAQSTAAGLVPFAGAGIDYASAYTNLQRGDVTSAGIDALFGTIDLVTDSVQALTYGTGIGAPVAAGGGVAAQLGTDATQAGLKKAIKEFGPAIAKRAKGAFEAVADYGKKAWTNTTGFAKNAWDKAAKTGSSIWSTISDNASSALAAGGTLLASGLAFGRRGAKPGAKFAKGRRAVEAGRSGRRTTKARGGRRGRGGGILNTLGNIADIGLFAGSFGLAASEALYEDPEIVARQQAASQERYRNTADAALKRGQSARLRSPLAGREVTELRDFRAEGLSQSEIRRRMGKGGIASSFEASGGFTQEQRRQETLAAQGFDIKAGQTVEEFLSTLNDTDRAAANAAVAQADYSLKLDALIANRKKEIDLLAEGSTARANAEQTLQNDIRAIESGEKSIDDFSGEIEKQIGATDMAAASAAELARNLQQFQKATAAITAVMTRASGAMKRISDSIDLIVAQSDDFAAARSGSATATGAIQAANFERDVQVLGNMQAFSPEEVSQTLARVTSTMGDSEAVQQAADLVQGQQVLDRLKPTLEAAMQGEDAPSQADLEKIIAEGFEGVPMADPNFAENFARETARSMVSTGGEGKQTSQAMEQKAKQAQEFLRQQAMLTAKALKAIAQQSDKYTQQLMKITDMEIRREQIGIETANNLKQALGFKLTPGEATAASQARVKGLTGGITDPNAIFNKMQEDLAKRDQMIKEAEGQGPDALKAAMTSGEFAELNKSINQSRQALEFLANDTTAADAALQRIADRDKQLKAQSDTALDLVSDPTKALEFIGQAQSLSRVLSGRGGQMDIGQGRALLGQLEGMIPQEQFAKLQEKFFGGAGASMGLSAEMAPFAAGVASDVEGKKRDPIMAKEIAAYEKAAKIREEAMTKLIALETESAENIKNSMGKIDTATSELAPTIDGIVNELTRLQEKLQQINGGQQIPAPAGGVVAAPPVPTGGALGLSADEIAFGRSMVTPEAQAMADSATRNLPPVPTGGASVAAAIPTALGTPTPAQAAPAPAAAPVAPTAAADQGGAKQVELALAGATTVNVSFSPDDMKALTGMGEAMQQEFGRKIAGAIQTASNGQLDILKYMS